MRSLDEINDKIRRQRAVVDTIEAFKARAAEVGIPAAYAGGGCGDHGHLRTHGVLWGHFEPGPHRPAH
jgi:hypothetical protein